MAPSMADAALSPQQAAQALADIAAYEDELGTRVGSLTGMVWGIVSAAIFTTYAMAADIQPRWLLPFLWLPWTLAGVTVTMAAWKLHAVSLRREHDGRRMWLWNLGFSAIFLAAVVLLNVLDVKDGAFSYMLVVNGIVAFVIVVAASRASGRWAAVPMVAAGMVLIAGAFVLPALTSSAQAMGLASAALVGISFVGASLVSFVRG